MCGSHSQAFTDMLEALTDALSSLTAATSLLKRGGKKAAPSDAMFNMMINDYENCANRSRAAIAQARKEIGE